MHYLSGPESDWLSTLFDVGGIIGDRVSVNYVHVTTSVYIILDSKTFKMLKYRIAKKSTNKISFHIHNNHFKQL